MRFGKDRTKRELEKMATLGEQVQFIQTAMFKHGAQRKIANNPNKLIRIALASNLLLEEKIKNSLKHDLDEDVRSAYEFITHSSCSQVQEYLKSLMRTTEPEQV